MADTELIRAVGEVAKARKQQVPVTGNTPAGGSYLVEVVDSGDSPPQPWVPHSTHVAYVKDTGDDKQHEHWRLTNQRPQLLGAADDAIIWADNKSDFEREWNRRHNVPAGLTGVPPGDNSNDRFDVVKCDLKYNWLTPRTSLLDALSLAQTGVTVPLTGRDRERFNLRYADGAIDNYPGFIMTYEGCIGQCLKYDPAAYKKSVNERVRRARRRVMSEKEAKQQAKNRLTSWETDILANALRNAIRADLKFPLGLNWQTERLGTAACVSMGAIPEMIRFWGCLKYRRLPDYQDLIRKLSPPGRLGEFCTKYAEKPANNHQEGIRRIKSFHDWARAEIARARLGRHYGVQPPKKVENDSSGDAMIAMGVYEPEWLVAKPKT